MCKVSIIVPIYNSEKYLETCLNSILNQTYKDIEIILVDDGSTDNSINIYEKYKKNKNIKIYKKANGGAASAKNLGIKKATGEYVCFIDSDDVIEIDYVEYLHNLITIGCYNMAIACYQVERKRNKHKHKAKQHKEQILSSKECLKKILNSDGITVSLCAKMYKTSFMRENLLVENYPYEDDEIMYKLIIKSKMIPYGSKIIYNYCIRNDSIMTKSFTNDRLILLKYADNMKNDILSNYPELNESINRKYKEYQLSILRQLVCIKTNEEQDKIKRELMSQILKDKREILISKNYAKRDKMAIFMLLFGEKAYAIAWKIYRFVKY